MTDDSEFQQTVAGQFSEMEKSMGREAYEARVRAEEANTANTLSAVRHNNALTLMLDAKSKVHTAYADAIYALARLAVLGAIPVLIMFWVYLFKLWVL